MNSQQYDFGMVGLGTMGRNLLLNMADHGFSIIGTDRDPGKLAYLEEEAAGKPARSASSNQEFIRLLKRPRAFMLLVPAGAAVDAVIRDVLPMLEPGDLIIDGGNSYFMDTEQRTRELAAQGIHFMGVGISGGEKGARFGPSMMPGGAKEAYEVVRSIFEAVAAKVNGEPCVTYLGSGAAGHYVKMVHNGIEYGLMQLISETYDLLKRGAGLTNDELHAVYKSWNEGELQSFLMEITEEIFLQPDSTTNGRLIDSILDAARQKGTGKWTSQSALDLGVPLSAIDVAVTMRYLSALKTERVAAANLLKGPKPATVGERETFIGQVRDAMYFATIVTYAQGMNMLRAASEEFGYGLNLHDIARIWRGGCIIRAKLLEHIADAYKTNPALPNLLVDTDLAKILVEKQVGIRSVASYAVTNGIPAPALLATLTYFDAYRSERLPSNLIQAQRDNFGAHTYERIDREGTFHTEWHPEVSNM